MEDPSHLYHELCDQFTALLLDRGITKTSIALYKQLCYSVIPPHLDSHKVSLAERSVNDLERVSKSEMGTREHN